MKLKTLSFGLAGALAFATAIPAAQAADIYKPGRSLKDTGPVDYAPVLSWTGFYIGANLGGAWDNTNDADLFDSPTLIGGAHIGYNWQRPNNVVLGVEGDVDFMDGVDYLATIRGRLGYAFGPTLVYATGGVAFAGFNDDILFDGGNSETGWVAGGGLEYKLRNNWSVGAEGLYYDFSNNNDFNFNDDATFWVARARLTYHLGGYGDGLK